MKMFLIFLININCEFVDTLEIWKLETLIKFPFESKQNNAKKKKKRKKEKKKPFDNTMS